MTSRELSAAQLRAWRKAEREALIARRMAVDAATLERWRVAIDAHLLGAFADLAHGVVAFCWPIQNEYDARHLARRLREAGATTALPVVLAAGQPLGFRAWQPGIDLAPGTLGIPYPRTGPFVTPDTFLVPMNGFDRAGYRLGYGAGFFDRTLAALAGPRRVIGVTYELAAMATIHPQPYDVPMDYVVTEAAVYQRRQGSLERL
jgi:5,10-methenyltetrahydrofolate synthetase